MKKTLSQSKRPSVLIVGHGSTITKDAEAAARTHGIALAQTGKYEQVVIHFLTNLDQMPDLPAGDVFLLPFFMSNGYFVTTKISEIFGLENFERHEEELHLYQCDAVGVDPMLTPILSKMVAESCEKNGNNPIEVDVVLLAHGSSQSPASREATETQEELLRDLRAYNSVSSAFLEEEPSLQNLVSERDRSRNPIVVVGFFSAEGPHAMVDVPAAIEKLQLEKNLQEPGHDLKIHYAGVVGVQPEIVPLIERSIVRRAGT